jgi:hypothetical protein
MRAETPGEYLTSSWFAFVSDAIDLPLGIVVIALVTTLQSWQSEKHGKLSRMAV